jgi:hypothetical protein
VNAPSPRPGRVAPAPSATVGRLVVHGAGDAPVAQRIAARLPATLARELGAGMPDDEPAVRALLERAVREAMR